MKPILLVLLLVASLVMATRADEIDISTNLASVVNGTSNSTSGAEYRLPYVSDYVLVPRITAAGVGTSNVTFGLNLRVGRDWTTTLPITVTVAANGTNSVVAYSYLNHTNLIGVSALRLDQVVTTQTNAVTISGLGIHR